ncbi:hypothetical protein [Tengunoibacter tsumagoiensis]|nr:hypothetical protein [Tengunoibacter tsumagoiensis]
MMQRFGGWQQYRSAPRGVVAEQIEEWSAMRQAEYDANKDNTPSS